MKHLKILTLMLVLSLMICTVSFAQIDSGKPGATGPVNSGPTTFRTINDIPDGIQPVVAKATGPVKRILDDLPELASPVYIPIWKQLHALSLTDRKNASIELEPLQNLSAGEIKDLKNIESLWNNGDFASAINALSKLEESSIEYLGLGVSWITPKALGVPDWGKEITVDSRGYTKETRFDFHDGTGNLFAVIRREGATDNTKWTTNISTNSGKSWSETYTWGSSLGDLRDASAVVADQHLYISYVPEVSGGTYAGMRLRRCMTNDGSVDSTYGYITVFDKGVDIKEVSMASNEDFYANRVYIVAILTDNSLIYYWDDYAAASWTESATGITDAYGSLDTTCNENFVDNFLIATYRNTTSRVHVAKKGVAWVVDDIDDMDLFTSIAAYSDHILVAYEFTGPSGVIIKYKISYNGGGSWSYGFVSSSISDFNYNPVVAARRDGGISVLWCQEIGLFDPVWYRHRDYASVNWSTPVTVSETDVYTTNLMDMEWIPTTSGDDYGAVWCNDNFDCLFDKTGALSGPLTADTTSVSEADGGEVNFTLNAGSSNKYRKYIILATISGTTPGLPLPGGMKTMPINWDAFTSGMIPYLNSPIFEYFLGTLSSTGKGAAQFDAPGPLPTGMAGIKINFAFACNKPWNYVSNPLEITVLP